MKKAIFLAVLILLSGTVFAIDFVPAGDINLKNFYAIKNVKNYTGNMTVYGNVSAYNYNITALYYFGTWQGSVISSEYLGITVNLTALNNSLNVLTTRESVNNATQSVQISSLNNSLAGHTHSAPNISSGTFGSGDYTFPNNVIVSQNLTILGGYGSGGVSIVDSGNIRMIVNGSLGIIGNFTYIGIGSVAINNTMNIVGVLTNTIPLTVSGASGQTANLTMWQNGGGTILSFITRSGGAYFNDSVGIGTANPTAKLEVAGNITSTTGNITITQNNKMCLDNSTCAKYIFFNGTHVVIQG